MKYSLLISIILLWHISFGQRINQKRYTANDGLMQTEVGIPLIMYDSMVYVVGISRDVNHYDGYKIRRISGVEIDGCCIGGFANFNDHSIIIGRKTFRIYKDKKFYVIPNTFDFKDNETQSYFVKNDTFWIYNNTQLYYIDSKENVYKKAKHEPKIKVINNVKDTIKSYFESKDGTVCYYVDGKNVKHYYSYIANDFFIPPQPKISGISKQYFDQNAFDLQEQFKFYGIYNFSNFRNDVNVIQLHNSNKPQIIIEHRKDSINTLGIVEAERGNISKVSNQCYLQGSHQGFHRLNPNIHFIKEGGNMVENLHTIIPLGDEILFGSYGNGFSIYKDYEVKTMPDNLLRDVMPHGIKHSNGFCYYLADGAYNGIYRLSKKGKKFLHEKLLDKTGYFIKELSTKETVIGSLDNNLYIIKDIDDVSTIQIVDKDKGVNSANILGIEEDHKGRLWYIGSGVGVYDRTLDTAIHQKKDKSIKHRIYGFTLKRDIKGTMWFGSGNGIYYLRNGDNFDPSKNDIHSSAIKINLPNGEETKVTAMEIIDSFLISASATSISFINLNSFYRNSQNPIINQLIYGEDIEGGGSEQNCILIDSQRRLWIGTQEGALMIEWNKFRFDHTKSKIKVYHLQAGDDTINVIGSKFTVELPANKRNLKIEFGLDKNISLLKNVFFNYTLISEAGDTIENIKYDQEAELEVKYLAPGKYTLNIIANKHGQLMDEIKITIVANRTLSENPMFWAGLFGFLLLSSIAFLLYRNNALKENLESKLRLSQLTSEKDQLKIQSIVSSFNPHFINNSLHWIQSRHIDDKDTVNMIGDLSENIRYVFETTKQGRAIHTLYRELQLVNNYVNVQLLRFGNSFKFIKPDQSIIDTLNTFPIIIMQLQIHVENAIEHGLRNRKQSSYVKLEIEEQESSITFIIEDDGGGRNKAKEIGSGGTQMGTKMLHDLHDIFNEMNENKIMTSYEDDIFHREDEKFGTRVRVIIPKSYQWKFN